VVRWIRARRCVVSFVIMMIAMMMVVSTYIWGVVVVSMMSTMVMSMASGLCGRVVVRVEVALMVVVSLLFVIAFLRRRAVRFRSALFRRPTCAHALRSRGFLTLWVVWQFIWMSRIGS